jgi:hypothetical protein
MHVQLSIQVRSYLCCAQHLWWCVRVVGWNVERENKFTAFPKALVRAQCHVEVHYIIPEAFMHGTSEHAW